MSSESQKEEEHFSCEWSHIELWSGTDFPYKGYTILSRWGFLRKWSGRLPDNSSDSESDSEIEIISFSKAVSVCTCGATSTGCVWRRVYFLFLGILIVHYYRKLWNIWVKKFRKINFHVNFFCRTEWQRKYFDVKFSCIKQVASTYIMPHARDSSACGWALPLTWNSSQDFPSDFSPKLRDKIQNRKPGFKATLYLLPPPTYTHTHLDLDLERGPPLGVMLLCSYSALIGRMRFQESDICNTNIVPLAESSRKSFLVRVLSDHYPHLDLSVKHVIKTGYTRYRGRIDIVLFCMGIFFSIIGTFWQRKVIFFVHFILPMEFELVSSSSSMLYCWWDLGTLAVDCITKYSLVYMALVNHETIPN